MPPPMLLLLLVLLPVLAPPFPLPGSAESFLDCRSPPPAAAAPSPLPPSPSCGPTARSVPQNCGQPPELNSGQSPWIVNAELRTHMGRKRGRNNELQQCKLPRATHDDAALPAAGTGGDPHGFDAARLLFAVRGRVASDQQEEIEASARGGVCRRLSYSCQRQQCQQWPHHADPVVQLEWQRVGRAGAVYRRRMEYMCIAACMF